jgi:anaerobic magnesium-protoporphyrin IX monomethyl ester cyclase
LLTIMTALSKCSGAANWKLAYLDGTVVGNVAIESFIEENAKHIAVACGSVLTSNYGAALRAFEALKAKNPSAMTILGNDHFSALFRQIMHRRPIVDFGFTGNDVVRGFTHFVRDLLSGTGMDFKAFPGLVFRDANGIVNCNPEDPTEISQLPLVDYELMNYPYNHRSHYVNGQQKTYSFMRELSLQSMVVDIGRGCLKFSGPRTNDIPINACDFCAIIPGTKAIAPQSANRAWLILENCFNSGFNYFYVTADELPLTFWPTLREMALHKPQWLTELPEAERPQMFGYTRAEAFVRTPERIDTLVDELRFNHFFIGFDGLSEISLKVMNKQPIGKQEHDLMWHNMEALNRAVSKKCLITGGVVLTHLGITREILEANFRALESSVEKCPRAFAALDFGPLCPIPGSQAFEYLRNPTLAEERARIFGLRVNSEFLQSVSGHYRTEDLFTMDDLVEDFVSGCCPDINMSDVNEYLIRTTELARKYDIVVGGGV